MKYMSNNDNTSFSTNSYCVDLMANEERLAIVITSREDNLQIFTILASKIFNKGFLEAYIKDAVDFIQRRLTNVPFMEPYLVSVRRILTSYLPTKLDDSAIDELVIKYRILHGTKTRLEAQLQSLESLVGDSSFISEGTSITQSPQEVKGVLEWLVGGVKDKIAHLDKIIPAEYYEALEIKKRNSVQRSLDRLTLKHGTNFSDNNHTRAYSAARDVVCNMTAEDATRFIGGLLAVDPKTQVLILADVLNHKIGFEEHVNSITEGIKSMDLFNVDRSKD